DARPGSDRRTTLHHGLERVGRRLGRRQALEPVAERPRITIVREDDTRADEDAILDGDAGADVDVGVHLDVVPDRHPIGDVRLFADDAVLTDRRGPAQVPPTPTRRAGAQLAARLDDCSWMDARRVTVGFHHALASRARRCGLTRATSTATHPPDRRER